MGPAGRKPWPNENPMCPEWPLCTERCEAAFCVYGPGAMPHEIPTHEPTELTASTSWRWDKRLSDHPPADGWTLKYALRGPSDRDIAATPNGDTYEVRIAATDTEIAAGPYRLVGFVENAGGDRFVVYDEVLRVLQSPLFAVNRKSHAERTLEVIEAVLEGRASDDEEQYQIGQKSVSKIPVDELHRLRQVYAEEVWRERNPGKLGPTIETVFGVAR